MSEDKPDKNFRVTNNNAVDMHVGKRIRLRRTLLGMSQEQLGVALSITFQQVQKYERGTNEVKSINLKKLSEYFDVSFDYWIKPILDANLTFLTKRRENVYPFKQDYVAR